MREIEWFTPDGVMGGERGLTVDLVNKKVISWNGIEEKINKKNIDSVAWVIDNNLSSLKDIADKLLKRIHQTKTERVKIENGYKISKKPTKEQMNNLTIKLKKINNEIKQISNIDIYKLIDLKN